MTRMIAALIIGLLVCGTALPAEAQRRSKRKAKKHFVAAQALEEVGNYEDAAHEYLKAYVYFPEPEFFYNAARAYELGGKLELALEYFEKYLVDDPRGRAAADAERHISELVIKIAKANGTMKLPTELPLTPSLLTGDDLDGQPLTRQMGHTSQHPRDTLNSRGSSRFLKMAGLTSAGVALVAGGLGIKFALDARRLGDEVTNVSEWTEENLMKFSQGESADRNAVIFLSISGVGLIAGGAMYFLGGRSGEKREVSTSKIGLSPILHPTRPGFAVHGSF